MAMGSCGGGGIDDDVSLWIDDKSIIETPEKKDDGEFFSCSSMFYLTSNIS